MVLAKSPEKAMDAFLKLTAIKRYVSTLESEREKQDFTRHMLKYINIWLPECPFEVSFTNRYEIDQWEARTTARKFIKTGEKIKFLCGNLVSITMGEEEDQSFIANAFSITYSSRKKTPSLFLGPARFANHDCNANSKLESRGSEGMVVIAVRNIEEGEEITVNYGENYFGEDNCECLCATCEKKGIGGWRYSKDGKERLQTPAGASDSENEEPGSRRSKRKLCAVNYKVRCRAPRVYDDDEMPVKRRKLDSEAGSMSTLSNTPRKGSPASFLVPPKAADKSPQLFKRLTPRDAAIYAQIGRIPPLQRTDPIKSEADSRIMSRSNSVRPMSPLSQRSSNSLRASNAKSPQQRSQRSTSYGLFEFLKRENGRSSLPSPAMSEAMVPSVELRGTRSQLSSVSSDGNSVFDRVDRQSASPLTEPSAVESQSDSTGKKSVSLTKRKSSEQPSTTPRKLRISPEPHQEESSQTDTVIRRSSRSQTALKSPLASPTSPTTRSKDSVKAAPLDKTIDTKIVKPGIEKPLSKSKAISEKQNKHRSSAADDGDDEGSGSESETEYRIPGDYIRTIRLLGPKNSRWVECHTCDDWFIQQEANQTRRECPRCERHSKLYGFQWPRTDYERGGPERVMDHRTVNRFLSRAEEMDGQKHTRKTTTATAATAVEVE